MYPNFGDKDRNPMIVLYFLMGSLWFLLDALLKNLGIQDPGFRIQITALKNSGCRSSVFETGRLKCLAFQTAGYESKPWYPRYSKIAGE